VPVISKIGTQSEPLPPLGSDAGDNNKGES